MQNNIQNNMQNNMQHNMQENIIDNSNIVRLECDSKLIFFIKKKVYIKLYIKFACVCVCFNKFILSSIIFVAFN